MGDAGGLRVADRIRGRRQREGKSGRQRESQERQRGQEGQTETGGEEDRGEEEWETALNLAGQPPPSVGRPCGAKHDGCRVADGRGRCEGDVGAATYLLRLLADGCQPVLYLFEAGLQLCAQLVLGAHLRHLRAAG